MSGHDRDVAQLGASFREAIAHWRLVLHTEVKRASSLPTAMFDACDPMLETRLAETTEAMLAHLHDPAPRLAADVGGGDATEGRLEVVTSDELRALPNQLTSDKHTPDLLTGLGAEYLATLADACCVATGTAQRRAVDLLCRDFGVGPDTDPAQLAQQIADQQDGRSAVARPASTEELDLTCRRIAATLTLYAPPATPRGPA